MSAPSVTSLLRTRRFLPLFLTQAAGALVENLYRQGVAVSLAFGVSASSDLGPATLAALAGAAFVAPAILLSAWAGGLADRHDKALLTRIYKGVELGLAPFAAWALAGGSVAGMYAVLAAYGCVAACFGPVKYSLLPAHLRQEELVVGNAAVEGATFLAVLLGSLAGGALAGSASTLPYLGHVTVVVALLAWVASFRVPPAPPVADPAPSGFIRTMSRARASRPVWLSILGISWFWTVGGVLLSLVPALARDTLGGGEGTAGLLLAAFSVGIAAGSAGCAHRLAGRITPSPVPFAALAMSVALAATSVLVAVLPVPPMHGVPLSGTAAMPGTWMLAGLLVLVAKACGFFVVPLYAIMQHEAPSDSKAGTVGANNVVNAAMLVAGMATVALLSSVLSFPTWAVLAVLCVFNTVAAVVSVRLLPRIVLRAVVRRVLSTLYRVEVRGADNVDAAGPRRIVVANHQSFLDGLVVAAFLPGDPVFAVNTRIATKWWARPLLALVDFATVDPTSPLAMRTLTREVATGRTLVIFPEGRLTVTGSLMKVYDGPALVAERTGADLVPVRIDGVQYTPFTRLSGQVASRLFPKVVMTVLPPVRLRVGDGVTGRERRRAAGRELYDVMSETIFRTSELDRTLFDALVDAADLHGRSRVIMEDADFSPVTYGRLLVGAFALGRALEPATEEDEVVGLLLPNSVGAVVTFMALQSAGRVPAMLNVSTGAAGMAAACRVAKVRTVLTSRRFVEKAKLDRVVAELSSAVRVLHLEDLRAGIGRVDKAVAAFRSRFPRVGRRSRNPAGPAVVLFTSGSEGTPKGVVLSHRNLNANRYQVSSRIDFGTDDTVFNALPMFHSFGLTVGTLLPLLAGVRVFLYPSPLHYRIVPELVYQTNATVMFSTDTFLRNYARVADPYDFARLRIVGAGAERVSEATRATWSEKFGVRLLEGYGATETSPVLAFNTPMMSRPGTVGRLMPGVEARIEPVPGIDGGGRLHVKGPNVMLGYLRDGVDGIEAPPDGWYDTGDLVDVDAEGYVTVKGRAKRFAKVAGEMVSLGLVEELAAKASPGFRHAALARPDARKGESVVLVSEDPGLDRAALLAAASGSGIPELLVPRTVLAGTKVPTLATGKTDYPALAASLPDDAARAA